MEFRGLSCALQMERPTKIPGVHRIMHEMVTWPVNVKLRFFALKKQKNINVYVQPEGQFIGKITE